MGDGAQDVERRTAFRRKAGVSYRRVMQVKAEILAQHTIFINVLQQPGIARAEHDDVMRNARPCSLDAEMDDEQRWRKTLFLKTARHALSPVRFGHQVAVGVNNVGVRRDSIGFDMPAAFRAHPGHFVAMRFDFGNAVIKAHDTAQPLKMRDHGRDKRLRTAAREPDTADLFQLVDQGIDARCFHGIAADQQRVKAQDFAQLFTFHERGNQRID